jgi:hypothetical protein
VLSIDDVEDEDAEEDSLDILKIIHGWKPGRDKELKKVPTLRMNANT